MILFSICVIQINITLAQIKISDDSYFLAIDSCQRNMVYFQSFSDANDEYLEGHVYKYDIKNSIRAKVDSDIFIVDFLKVKFLSCNKMIISNGTDITAYDIDNMDKEIIYSCKQNELILDFSISNNSILISLKEIDDNKIQIINYSILTSKESIIHSEDIRYVNESSDLDLYENENFIFINSAGMAISFNKETQYRDTIDSNVTELLFVDQTNIYYLKSNSIWRYSFNTSKRFDIVSSDNLKVTFFNTYKSGFFIGLNDNILVYNEIKEKAKIVEDLPKAEYLFFSNEIAIYKNKLNSLFLIKNFEY
ncbi:MAG: hypothetical protein RID05_14250 [Cytophagales bacterium]